MKTSIKLLTICAFTLALSSVSASSISAQGRRSPWPTPSASSRQVQACQAREAGLKTRSTNLSRMATDMLEKFDKIAARVQDYYTRSGKTVANYDSLVAAITTKRSAVQSALTAAQSDVASFNCTVANPRQHLTQFQTHMKTVKSALKEYRTAIKNLIVAVRSVVGEEQSETSRSPRPSMTPKSSSVPNVNANPNSLRRYAQ